MLGLEWYQYLIIALLFAWSGLVRSGFGFGGAVFSLPFLLLVSNQPLIFLPVVAIHLLIFSSLTVYQNQKKHGSHLFDLSPETSTVDWAFLKKALLIMIVPKLIGVLGLITLPTYILSSIIFVIIAIYALSYIFNVSFNSKNTAIDFLLLVLGGYISGTSLIGAPLIVAVFAQHVVQHKLRDTLFVLWFILVFIKMASLIYYDVDLQLIHQLWLLPCAMVGHIIGLRIHAYMLSVNTQIFYRYLGAVLLLASTIGLSQQLLT